MIISIQDKFRRRKFINNNIIPRITLIQSDNIIKKHCFSVCLYLEPTYLERFPNRNFFERYLESIPEVKQFLEKTDSMIRIFCDEKMVEKVLEFGFGEIYLVEDQPEFPFQQHIYRYYSVLFPNENIKTHNFRGLDNVYKEDLRILDRFLDLNLDVLHAPYQFTKISKELIPVRGSCSVANNGIESLKKSLEEKRPKKPSGIKEREFHNDELFLKEWYEKNRYKLNFYTFIDRLIPTSAIFLEIFERLKKGKKIFLEGNFDKDGPMRSKPII